MDDDIIKKAEEFGFVVNFSSSVEITEHVSVPMIKNFNPSKKFNIVIDFILLAISQPFPLLFLYKSNDNNLYGIGVILLPNGKIAMQFKDANGVTSGGLTGGLLNLIGQRNLITIAHGYESDNSLKFMANGISNDITTSIINDDFDRCSINDYIGNQANMPLRIIKLIIRN